MAKVTYQKQTPQLPQIESDTFKLSKLAERPSYFSAINDVRDNFIQQLDGCFSRPVERINDELAAMLDKIGYERQKAGLRMLSSDEREDVVLKVCAEKAKEPEEIVERVWEIHENYEGIREMVEKVRVVAAGGKVSKEILVSRVRELVERERPYREVVGKLLEVVRKADKMRKEEITSAVKECASRSKGAMGKELTDAIEEGKKKGARKEDVIEKIKEVVSGNARKIAIVDELERIVAEAEKLSKGDILSRLNGIVEGWKKEIERLQKVVKESEDLLRKKPAKEWKKEEWIREVEKILLREKEKELAADLRRKSPGPAEGMEWLKRVLEDVATNPYMRRIQSLVRDSAMFSKDEMVTIVRGIADELEDIEKTVSGLGRIVANSEKMTKENVLAELRRLLMSVYSDRIGRKLVRIIEKVQKENLDKAAIVSELQKILPCENHILVVLSRFYDFLNRKDEEGLRKFVHEIGRLLGMLRQVNHGVRSIRQVEGEVDVVVKKGKMGSVVLRIARELEKQKARDAEAAQIDSVRELFGRYASGRLKAADFEKSLKETWRMSPDANFVKNEIVEGLKALLKLGKLAGVEETALALSETAAKSSDSYLSFCGLKTLYALAESEKEGDFAALKGFEGRVADAIGEVLKRINGKKGESTKRKNRRMRLMCIDVLGAVALRSPAAVRLLKMLQGDRDRLVRERAGTLMEELGL